MPCRRPAPRGASSGRDAARATAPGTPPRQPGAEQPVRPAERRRAARAASSAACAGRLPTSRPSDRSRVLDGQRGPAATGSRSSGRLASSTYSACCRSRRCSAAAGDVHRPSPVAARLGVVHHGVGDDDHPVAGQVGPPAQVDVVAAAAAAGGRSRRARPRRRGAPACPAVPTASTARVPSCWPWSCSRRSRPVSRRPLRAMVTPTSSSSRRSPRPSTLGPATAIRGSRATSASSCSRASGAGAQSSCSSQTQLPVRLRREPRAAWTAAPKPVRGRERRRPRSGTEPVARVRTASALPSSCCAGVGRDHDVRRPGLGGERGLQPGQPAAAVVGDHHRVTAPWAGPPGARGGWRSASRRPTLREWRQAQTALFFRRRRSRSDSPPQMPNRSSFIRAYSRHSARTSQPRQTFFASRVEPPFSGKNASGSVWAHRRAPASRSRSAARRARR